MNRAFRISFDHKVSKFVIEIQGFLGLRWHPTRGGSFRNDEFKPTKYVNYYDTFEEAEAQVKKLGLSRIYTDFTKSKPWTNHIAEIAAIQPVIPQPTTGAFQ